MVNIKINRLVWGILLLICLLGIIVSSKDMLYIYLYIIGSGIVFIKDYYDTKKQYDPNWKNILLIKRWHIYANITQWLFWIVLLYFLFISVTSLGYKSFIIGDLFIVATFAIIKYNKQGHY
ncbi:hypothetical protein [Clostridium sp.]|uniref:hypothetical protein n=1 Tax=Clostridium sp. TaxID=1506 RepID=UPI001A4DB2C2|nr:hypothetical protein [Clostridium sp.]MBK5243243.1 hypothetical protein [Clostridium sp.]